MGPSAVPQRLGPLHQHLIGISSENSHRLVDKLGEGHSPGFVVAAQQVGLHPRRRQLQNPDPRAFELVP